MTTVTARIAALKACTTRQLRKEWRALYNTEPPRHSRSYLESRLIYRLQELEFGGLSRTTVQRLETLGRQLDGGNVVLRRIRVDDRPIVGTRLIREWQGVEHTVTVQHDGYEWQGKAYKSLSSVARAITGTRWNGWAFFGLKSSRGRR